MLETMRKHSRSFFIYLIFGILIAVFVISFGPQSGQQTSCSSAEPTVARVNGREIPHRSWRFALNHTRFGNASSDAARQARVRENLLDGLIEREVLAQAAEERGFKISDDEVEARIAEGEYYLLGDRLDGRQRFFKFPKDASKPVFNYELLESYVINHGLTSVEQFLEEQKREMLAQKMRELLEASVRVSPDEVQQAFLEQNSSVEVDFVKLEPARFRDLAFPTREEIDAYVKANEAELKKKYDADPNRWKGRAKEVRLRHIFVMKGEPPAAPEPGPDQPKPEPMPDPKRAKIEAALAKIKAGADFATIAKETSEDEPTAKRGGLGQWRGVKALGYGDTFAQAVEKLEIGAKPKEVIVSERGYHLVIVEGRREGDLSFDQVKTDLAETAVLEEKSKRLARETAEAALAQAKAGKKLDELFPPEPEDEDETPDPDEPAKKPVDPTKPKLVKGAVIRRSGTLLSGGAGKFIGRSAELTKALFNELKPGEVAPKVYEVDGNFVILAVVKRDEPDMSKLAEAKDGLAETLAYYKRVTLVSQFENQACQEKKDDITVSKDFSEYPEDEEIGPDGKPVPRPKRPPQPQYVPCSAAGAQLAGAGFDPAQFDLR